MATHSSTLAWKIPWAAVYALTQNRTQLKQLSAAAAAASPIPFGKHKFDVCIDKSVSVS